MARASIEVRPSLEELKRDDRLVMSMPVEVPVPETRPDPPLMAEWFAGMASVHPDSEREVELHFASPLFREGPALTGAYRRFGTVSRPGLQWLLPVGEIILVSHEEIRYANADCC